MARFTLVLLLTIASQLIVSSTTFAQSQGREWSDASGKFKVVAKLLEYNDETVRLLKPDGRVVRVPLKALSDADKKFIAELKKKSPPDPFAGGEPLDMKKTSGASTSLTPNAELLREDANVVELPTNGKEVYLKIDSDLPSLLPDPTLVQIEVDETAWPIEGQDAYTRLSPPICIDPKKGLFAVSSHRRSNASADTEFGKIHLISPNSRQAKLVIELETTLMMVAHHTPSNRSLAMINVDDGTCRGGDILLMDGLASGKPQPVVRWHLPEWKRPGFKPKVEFAQFLGDKQVFVRVNDAVYLWDLVAGTCKWKIDRVSSGKVQLSGGGKYLAVPAGGKVRIVETANGELLGTIKFPSLLTPEVRFSPDGKKLAMVGGNKYVIWDLVEANMRADMTIGTSSGKFFGWVGNDYLMSQHGGLIDPEMRMTLWSYMLPPGREVLPISNAVITSKQDSEMSMVYVLPVPHGPVAAAAAKLKAGDDKMMAVRPGSEVALKVIAPDEVDQQQMLSALQAAVEESGWKVNPSASIKVTAKIERGEKETYYFRHIGAPILLQAPTKVSIRPYKANLVITEGSKKLWSVGASRMVPYIVHLKEGQTIKKRMKEYEKPDPDYFKRIVLPRRILKPEFAKHVGRSMITDGKWKNF